MLENLSRKIACYNSDFFADFHGRVVTAETILWVGAPRCEEAAAYFKQALNPHSSKWAVELLSVSKLARKQFPEDTYFVKAMFSAVFEDDEVAFTSTLDLLRSLHSPVEQNMMRDASVDVFHLAYEPAHGRDGAYVIIVFNITMREEVAALLGEEAAVQTLNEYSGEASWIIWRTFLKRLSEHNLRFSAKRFWKTPTAYSRVDGACRNTVHFCTGVRLHVEDWSWTQDVIKRALQGNFNLHG